MGGMTHDKDSILAALFIPRVVAVLSGAAISAQDKCKYRVGSR
jgi:hypothetical protein